MAYPATGIDVRGRRACACTCANVRRDREEVLRIYLSISLSAGPPKARRSSVVESRGSRKATKPQPTNHEATKSTVECRRHPTNTNRCVSSSCAGTANTSRCVSSPCAGTANTNRCVSCPCAGTAGVRSRDVPAARLRPAGRSNSASRCASAATRLTRTPWWWGVRRRRSGSVAACSLRSRCRVDLPHSGGYADVFVGLDRILHAVFCFSPRFRVRGSVIR